MSKPPEQSGVILKVELALLIHFLGRCKNYCILRRAGLFSRLRASHLHSTARETH
jgi:hypothetical protein